MANDLVMKLRAACDGHPAALIPWPHRLLHDAADEIERLTLALNGYGKHPEECTGADGEGACVSHMAYEELRESLRKKSSTTYEPNKKRRTPVGAGDGDTFVVG